MRYMRYIPLTTTLLLACTGRDIVSDASSSGEPETTDPWALEPDPAFFAEGCAKILSCDCENPRFDSPELCEQLGAAAMIGAELETIVLGLHFDRTCYRDLGFFDNDLRYDCMTYPEYQRTHPDDLWYPTFDSCGACSPGYGDRQLGESCTTYHTALSDCAQGLKCEGDVCRDPCVVLGTPCESWFDVECQTGYDKDTNWDHRFICDEATKHCTGGVAGEPCINPNTSGSANFCGGPNWELECVEGLCQPTPLPGKGESCFFERPCAKGLVCLNHQGHDATCEVPALEGEPCPFEGLCDAFLRCVDQVCVKAPQAGEPCASDGTQCGAYLQCEDGTCVAMQPAVCG